MTELESNLFDATWKIFNKAAATGISEAIDNGASMPDNNFLNAVKHNNGVFAAFRTHRMQNDIAAQLTTKDGRLKSFSHFAKDVQPYIDHKNRAWLRTEYDTAVSRAHRAADWRQFEQERDVLPNLEWMPSTSVTPGEDHRVFWGTVLPIDDPFWEEHKPGDRWNCKCRLRNTDRNTTQTPIGTTKDDPSKGLENNPGKDGALFSQKHAYFPSSCGSCPFGNRNLFAALRANKKDCSQCKKLDRTINNVDINKKRVQFNAYGDKYEKTFFDDKTGGYVVTEKERIKVKGKASKNDYLKYEKEKEMCKLFAKGGHSIIHLNEESGISSSDVLFDGIRADLKRTRSPLNIMSYARHAVRKQNAKLVLFQFDDWNNKFNTEIKNLQKENIHGYYIITGKKEIVKY